MPRVYKRKTNRGSTPLEDLERAAKEVSEGKSIRSVAREQNINRMTLKRYIDQIDKGEVPRTGYDRVAKAHKIFNDKMESELASHIKRHADQFHGLSSRKCRELAYELAIRNDIPIPKNWSKEERAGRDWFNLFKKRHHLSCQSPGASSLGRIATAFNKHTVGEFFNNLASVMDRYKFPPNMIYNMDETGVGTVQLPKQIVAKMGKKQVSSVTSGERGELVIVVCAISATGNAIPPMFIFPRVRYMDHFIRGAPTGSTASATKSGWTNQEVFVLYLDYVIRHTNCSKDHPVLLILDNHAAHVSLKAVETAMEKGIVMLALPPHTSHCLQPLNNTVYGPLKIYYNRALDGWMQSNPGKTASIYDIPELVNVAFMSAMTPDNISSGFRSTGIFPFNRDVFPDAEFEPSVVTERPNPEQPSTSADQPAPPSMVVMPLSPSVSAHCMFL